jgi:hypothetical protein
VIRHLLTLWDAILDRLRPVPDDTLDPDDAWWDHLRSGAAAEPTPAALDDTVVIAIPIGNPVRDLLDGPWEQIDSAWAESPIFMDLLTGGAS